jgi:hypothetical protein
MAPKNYLGAGATSGAGQLERLKAYCPRCDGERSCDVHALAKREWEEKAEPYNRGWQEYHRLLQCRGCELIFYYLKTWNSHDWDMIPNPATGQDERHFNATIVTHPAQKVTNTRPDWTWDLREIDHQLSKILEETYQAYETSSFILASVGMRTAFDRAAEFLGIDPGDPLAAKVKTLREKGFIGETEAMTLDVVVNAGSAAAHRGWSPDKEKVRTLLTTLEQFIYRTIISGKKALEIAPEIPPRPPRASKASK